MLIFRNLVAWIFTFSYFSTIIALYLITFRRFPDRWIVKAHHFWGKTAAKLLGVEIILDNPSTLIEVRPRVIVCNHQSGLDLIWPGVVCPPNIVVIGKKEIIYVPVFNLAWWAFRFIRIDRKNTREAIFRLRGVSKDILMQKRSLFVAPEGTRTPDGAIHAFKKGAFHIAMECGIPIYPIVISGAFELLPKGKFIAKPGKMRIHFLPPVETKNRKPEELEKLIAEVHSMMVQAKDKMERPSAGA